MNEHELVIPFDAKALRENIFLKILKKVKNALMLVTVRTIDIILSLIGIIFLIPFSVVVAFQNLKNKDYGKTFYIQERIGKNGKLFKMYKFRTMVNNADEILEAMLQDKEIKAEYEKYRKFQDDPRLTKFGKFLRETSLDEVPQVINVLKGQMSIVGPRPYMPEEKERMDTYYNYIIQHKPGITGVYQIAGKERVEFLDRLDMDLRYHYRKNLLLDIKIGLITLFVTLKRKDTFGGAGDITMDTIGYISKEITLFVKRIIDILGAIVGIAILIPLIAIVWIGNKICKDKGPIFYSHERIGKDGKHFKMYKFRSMVVGADDILKELLAKDDEARVEYSRYKKLKHDPRITKMGKILRKTSLDEFPQFINVLKGDMSLVGPRAYLPREKEDMGEAYETIIQCKPGVTGLWQVSGRNETTFKDRLKIDMDYFENYDLGLDLEILIKTVVEVIRKEGAV